MTTKSLIEQVEALADPDTRRWQKLADLNDELAAFLDAAQNLAAAIEELGQAVEAKDYAMEEAPADRSDSLASAWDDACTALESIALNAADLQGLY